MSIFRPCMDCVGEVYPAEPGKRKCVWHGLMKKPIEEQIEAAEGRRAEADELSRLRLGGPPVARVPKSAWPIGKRWCSGCQGYVPLFYCSGSRCKAHNALAAHSGRLESTYGIDRATYVALLDLQDGKCYICNQVPRTKRLAVDHDHKTGEVRGLLCADVERGCNHAVLGSLEARTVDTVIAAAYRLIDYMTKTPYQRHKEAENDQSLERTKGRSDGDLHLPGPHDESASDPASPEVPQEAATGGIPDWAAKALGR